MKILVLSDSHRLMRNTNKVFQKLHKVVDIAVHLGDCFSDMAGFPKKYPKIVFHSVTGNCDFSNIKAHEELVFEVNSKKFLLTHGHTYSVKFGYQELICGVQGKEVDVCLFGHTHRPEIFESNGIIFMNPGSITFPKDRFGPTYGILDIDDDGKICVSIVELDNKVIFQL